METTPLVAPDLAATILHGIKHLSDWLPGRPESCYKDAATGCLHSGWSADRGCWGETHRDGIGVWAGHMQLGRKPAEAVLFIPWRQVRDVVAAGLGDGRLEAYEAAKAVWLEWVEAAHPRNSFAMTTREWMALHDQNWPLYRRAHDGLHSTTAAIVRAGAAALADRPEQGTLF